jgi:hypothetical protein
MSYKATEDEDLKILSRDEILTALDITRERVPVPEWGGAVWVQGMTGTERDAFEASIVQQSGRGTRTVNLANARAKVVALSVVDKDGKRVFSQEDVTALGRKSAAALQRVFSVAQRLSGLRDEDMEELVKNSKPGRNGGSGSSSPEPSTAE